jgi:hypothetical protein
VFNWSWGLGSRRPAGPVARLAAAVALVLFMAARFGPAISAADRHGTRGYFVARSESCARQDRTWSGRCRLPDGKVTRQDVSIDGAHRGMLAGSTVPALDAADFADVFRRHGSYQWLEDLAIAVSGIANIGQATTRARAKRRRESTPRRSRRTWTGGARISRPRRRPAIPGTAPGLYRNTAAEGCRQSGSPPASPVTGRGKDGSHE